MSGGMPIGSLAYSYGYKQTTTGPITETRSLTGVQTKSDAWGKVIPLTFGRTRVPGVLIWASDFYKTTSDFDTTVTIKSKYYNLTPTLDQYGFQNGAEATSQGTSTLSSEVTHNSVTASNIDLCYSLGKDGDPRKKRYVDKVRVNDIIVYDSQTGYIAPGIGFNVRYGYNNNIDPLMAKYDNGDLFYKDQTLLIFNKFPLENFGDAVPQSVDVEFGCVAADLEIYPCQSIDCGYKLDLDKPIGRQDAAHDRIAAGEVKWTNCHIILLTVAVRSDFSNVDGPYNRVVLDNTINRGVLGFTAGSVTTLVKQVTEAEAIQYNKTGVQLLTPFNQQGRNLMAGRVRVLQLPSGWSLDPGGFQDPAETSYPIKQWSGPSIVFRDAFVYADFDGSQAGVVTTADPVIQNPVAGIQQASHMVVVPDGATADDGGPISCPGRYYFAVASARFNYKPCEAL